MERGGCGFFGWLFKVEPANRPRLVADGGAFSHDVVGEASYHDAVVSIAGPTTKDTPPAIECADFSK